jgi:prepilin-type N-terminal cleavage/methylation domain-containing protein
MSRIVGSREDGFVLLELLVVLGIMGIVISGAVFGARKMIPRSELEAGTYEIISDFRRIQQQAISEQRDYGIRFDDENNEYIVFNDDEGDIRIKELDKNLVYHEIRFGGDKEVTFKAIGTADNGHVTLINDNGMKYRITVSGQGRVRVEKED